MSFAGGATRAHLQRHRHPKNQLKQRNPKLTRHSKKPTKAKKLTSKEETHSSSGGFLSKTLSVLPDACPLLEEPPVVQGVGVRRQGSAEDQEEECVKVGTRRGSGLGMTMMVICIEVMQMTIWCQMKF